MEDQHILLVHALMIAYSKWVKAPIGSTSEAIHGDIIRLFSLEASQYKRESKG